ncbi:class I SAM-dependent methyltransferase [Pelagerythrobacter rhizovicinus]|uniref:Class I SAM-dependent methyltransferase n=1 Tax=Pelagerythrobacter rhizovicinus TaxID=2268576 RepID=A0A4Q2KNE3_9SPHN|nr:class I SAM-dependent methyltransferase [Pelagerythrobacter rhizovicinus]RXZ65830.1 class I SAM-dependent methyltransferase [Pelagerythrobacter rhizovicinus]
MSDPATLAFYEREAPRYTASTTQAHSRHLDPFLDRLAPGARILELGCGAGRDAARMIERGFDVAPTDGSAAMAAKAQERIGRSVRVMMFAELEAEDAFDAVWAHASLLHLSLDELRNALSRIVRALRPGGWHFANYKLGDGEGRDRFGRYYSFPREAELRAVYSQAGSWKEIAAERYAGSGFDGMAAEWLALTMRA